MKRLKLLTSIRHADLHLDVIIIGWYAEWLETHAIPRNRIFTSDDGVSVEFFTQFGNQIRYQEFAWTLQVFSSEVKR